MKPGDLVWFKEAFLSDEFSEDEFYRGKIGVIIEHHVGEFENDKANFFDVLLGGRIVGGFDYELELIE
jgi:hypothetical protein